MVRNHELVSVGNLFNIGGSALATMRDNGDRVVKLWKVIGASASQDLKAMSAVMARLVERWHTEHILNYWEVAPC